MMLDCYHEIHRLRNMYNAVCERKVEKLKNMLTKTSNGEQHPERTSSIFCITGKPWRTNLEQGKNNTTEKGNKEEVVRTKLALLIVHNQGTNVW
jgi:hypothetical protein